MTLVKECILGFGSESTYDFTLRKNQEYSKRPDCELVHYLETKEYETISQNRKSISSKVIQAIKKNGKLFNRITVKTFETDLVRNFKETKSTKETHDKKIEKVKQEFSIA